MGQIRTGIEGMKANVFAELHYRGSHANMDDYFHHKGKNYHLMGRTSTRPWVHTPIKVYEGDKKPTVRQGFKGDFQARVKGITERGRGEFYTVGPDNVYFKWTVEEEN